ncbi:MAG: hypothetical protein RQ826_07150 [Xanthomonadales bacterium]|nr:hypothetical protein [Xanthomonadales bacterium]
MRKLLILGSAVLLLNTAMAQDDAAELEVVLPKDAQKCVLPASPNAIPEDADYDQLVEAKKQVDLFQEKLMEFRDCLSAAEDDEKNTVGNKQAIVASYNYSVEMEERVAERFNEAIRGYKERQAAEG